MVAPTVSMLPRRAMLDTNIVLDVLLFADAAAVPLRAELEAGRLLWLATAHMREELRRVLHYPHIASRVSWHGHTADGILQRMDGLMRPVPDAPRCSYVCKDGDDQCFIDLAVQHQALLLSKDGQVLRLRKRLARVGVPVLRAWPEALSLVDQAAGDCTMARATASATLMPSTAADRIPPA